MVPIKGLFQGLGGARLIGELGPGAVPAKDFPVYSECGTGGAAAMIPGALTGCERGTGGRWIALKLDGVGLLGIFGEQPAHASLAKRGATVGKVRSQWFAAGAEMQWAFTHGSVLVTEVAGIIHVFAFRKC